MVRANLGLKEFQKGRRHFEALKAIVGELTENVAESETRRVNPFEELGQGDPTALRVQNENLVGGQLGRRGHELHEHVLHAGNGHTLVPRIEHQGPCAERPQTGRDGLGEQKVGHEGGVLRRQQGLLWDGRILARFPIGGGEGPFHAKEEGGYLDALEWIGISRRFQALECPRLHAR